MKVLLIQLRQLGDVLLSSPLARVVKEEIPNAEVHFLASVVGKDILKGNPFIDKILTIENGLIGELKTILKVRREKYDAVIDVQRTGRSKRITFFSGAFLKVAFRKRKGDWYYNRLVDWKDYGYTAWERMELLKGLGIEDPVRKYLPKIYNVANKCSFLDSLKLDKFVVIVPTARKSEKMWSLESYAKLIDFLERRLNLPVVVLYGPGEIGVVKKLLCLCSGVFYYPSAPLSISELAYVVGSSAFFVGNNSFASHVSVAMGRPTVVVDKRKSGWFPPVDFVYEVYGDNDFPSFEDVAMVCEEVLKKRF